MTDMHRNRFVRNLIKWWHVQQAALRYRDEQACCDCAYTCKFCRDEQEKQA